LTLSVLEFEVAKAKELALMESRGVSVLVGLGTISILMLGTVAIGVAFSFDSLFLPGGDAQDYQWSCSPLDTANNRYYLPDLPTVPLWQLMDKDI